MPVAWEVPLERFDALLLTSANGARQGIRPELARLPCYAVGEATAAAARAAGATEVVTGRSDAEAAVALMALAGVKRALHLCGRDHVGATHPAVVIERRTIYAAEAVDALTPEALSAVDGGVLALLHSPRAAALFGSLVPDRAHVSIAVISPVAAEAAGADWASIHIAERPSDQALLELAARLCKTGALPTTKRDA